MPCGARPAGAQFALRCGSTRRGARPAPSGAPPLPPPPARARAHPSARGAPARSWFTQDARFPSTWINAHITADAALGKPLLLEEFGKSAGRGNKEGVYEDVYGALERSLAANGPLRGALFWRWSLEGGDDTAVNAGDSVWGCGGPATSAI